MILCNTGACDSRSCASDTWSKPRSDHLGLLPTEVPAASTLGHQRIQSLPGVADVLLASPIIRSPHNARTEMGEVPAGWASPRASWVPGHGEGVGQNPGGPQTAPISLSPAKNT